MKKAILILGSFLFLFACSTKETDKKSKLEQLKKEHDKLTVEITKLEKELYPAGSNTATAVKVQAIKKAPFEHYIEVQGRIDGNENIAVSPRTPGVVTKIFVKEGDYVKKGQILAELDAEVLKQTRKELQAQLDYATDLYNRQKALWDQKIGSEVQFLSAKNSKESLENKINTLEDQIRMSNITAPIDGTIEEIPIKVGQMASASSPLPAFRIVNFSKAKALADVGEAYSAKVKTGDPVKIYLPDVKVEQTQSITFSSKYINPTNRTFLVEVDLPPSNIMYRANMIAILRIKDYANESTIAIPQNYIQSSRDEGQFVFVAAQENGKKVARKRVVIPFISYNGLTEIVTGLNEGDLIITAGFKDLYDGQIIDYSTTEL
ncbi:MAG: efflux RND transporter periplasmic adaptor subunit [bacterium]